MSDLIVVKERISNDRARLLYSEFCHAWNKCSTKEKLTWFKDTFVLFGKVTFRRGKGLLQFAKKLVTGAGKASLEMGKAVIEDRGKEHFFDQADKFKGGSKKFYGSSKKVLKNTISVLKNNPKESGPILFLGILGFFCGAGFQVGEKAFYDIDGGIPDLDIAIGGIGAHRSPITHSVIAGAIVETAVFSSVKAAQLIHKNLPSNHDNFWDGIKKFNGWGTAFASGACTGIAYHLLIDGTLDGNKAMNGLPFSMSMEGHNAVFVGNAAAEAIDINKKNQNITCSCPSKYKVLRVIEGATKVRVDCENCNDHHFVNL